MLSAIIITKNEGATIARCLQNLAFTDEQIVIDSGSTDTTVQQAQALGAIVITNPWPGYGAQKNFGASHAQGDWLLFIDADEVIPPALQQEILAAINQAAITWWWLKNITIFLGKELRHTYGHNLRLFKRGVATWTESEIHEQVITSDSQPLRLTPQSHVLPTPYLHYSHQTIASYLHKMHRYTSLDAQFMSRTGRHRSGRVVRRGWLLPWALGSRQFIKLWLYRGGWLDGWAGLTWALLSGYYEWEMAQKFLRLTSSSS